MGLYFVYVKDLSNRFNDHIFCFKQNKCYLYSKEDEYSELFNVDKDILDSYKKIVLYAYKNHLENASKEFSYHKIKEMIEFQTKCGWNFIFQVANIDTIAKAGRLGIDRRMASSLNAQAMAFINQ